MAGTEFSGCSSLRPAFRKLIMEKKRKKLWPSPLSSARNYEQLLSYDEDEVERRPVVPRGYVPVIVGSDNNEEAAEEMFLVHVKMLRKPCIAALLRQAAEVYGYEQEGVLRIPCGAEHFRKTIGMIC